MAQGTGASQADQRRKPKKNFYLNEEADDEGASYGLFTVKDQCCDPITVQVLINKVPVRMSPLQRSDVRLKRTQESPFRSWELLQSQWGMKNKLLTYVYMW